MPSIDYSSTPSGGYQATVDASGGSAGGPGGGDYGWMMELARRRAEQKLRMGGLEARMAELQLRNASTASHKANAPKLGGSDPYERQMKELAMRDQVAQVNARTGTAPMKFVSPMGSTGGFYTPDENAMNYYQRQAFLPKEAGVPERFEAGRAPSEIAAAEYASRQARNRADEEGIASAAARMAGTRPGYFPRTQGSLG